MRLATFSILLSITFIVVAFFNRPINVRPLELPPTPAARNNIHFPPIEQHIASSPSPATSTYVNILLVHP